MDYKIIEIPDNTLKKEYVRAILAKLPDWFGNKNAVEEYCRNNHYEYIIVKTLSEMWDKGNPCLIMIKKL